MLDHEVNFNMHSSNYKLKMAITCNPPITLCATFFISRGAEGPGREILQCPPSICPSIRLSVRPSVTVTQKRIDVFPLSLSTIWGKTIISHLMFPLFKIAHLSICPSIRLSVRPSVTVTQKRIDVFSRNFAGTCTMSWGCAV